MSLLHPFKKANCVSAFVASTKSGSEYLLLRLNTRLYTIKMGERWHTELEDGLMQVTQFVNPIDKSIISPPPFLKRKDEDYDFSDMIGMQIHTKKGNCSSIQKIIPFE
jgi:hypothetical protein